MKYLDKNVDLGLLILRLALGVLLLLHGISKLMNGVGGVEHMLAEAGLPTFIAYGVYVGEVIIPLFLIAGVATRIAALIYAFNMLVAILLAHSGDILSLSETGGWAIELPALFFFGAVALIFTGGGKYALSNKYLWD